MIRFSCPSCGRTYQVVDEHAGRQAQCTGCNSSITVPALDPPADTQGAGQQSPTDSRQLVGGMRILENEAQSRSTGGFGGQGAPPPVEPYASGWQQMPGAAAAYGGVSPDFVAPAPVSKALYLGAYLGGAVIGTVLLAIGGFLAGDFEQNAGNSTGPAPSTIIAALTPILLGGGLYLFGWIMHLVLMYKMWAAIQDPYSKTTPGKAVGFMFIPCFNLYWIFVAYAGWAKDFNRFVTAQNLRVPLASEGLALMIPIMMLCGIIPYVGSLASIVQLILTCIFVAKGCDAINSLAALNPAPAAPSTYGYQQQPLQ